MLYSRQQWAKSSQNQDKQPNWNLKLKPIDTAGMFLDWRTQREPEHDQNLQPPFRKPALSSFPIRLEKSGSLLCWWCTDVFRCLTVWFSHSVRTKYITFYNHRWSPRLNKLAGNTKEFYFHSRALIPSPAFYLGLTSGGERCSHRVNLSKRDFPRGVSTSSSTSCLCLLHILVFVSKRRAFLTRKHKKISDCTINTTCSQW